MQRPPSILPDDLLQHLIAVGQVDVLVGLPTLNHADTVGGVVGAVHEAFVRRFTRERAVLINSDGGSTDGTPEVVRQAGVAGATVQATHALRTVHRVTTPYHGLPGKRSAVRTIFSAATLLQARVVAIVDPATVAPDPDVFAAMVRTVLREGYDFAGLAPRRHPREAPLVSQVLRPVIGAAYGTTFDDPLGEEFAASDRFVFETLQQDIWTDDALRAGIDLKLHTQAHAAGYKAAELRLPPRPRPVHGHRPNLVETVQQLVLALWTSMERDEPLWPGAAPGTPVTTIGHTEVEPEPPSWDLKALETSFREGVHTLEPILSSVLSPPSLARLRQAAAVPEAALVNDEFWVDLVCECTSAWRARRVAVDQVTGAFVPLYLGRAASFLRETEHLPSHAVHSRLDALAHVFLAARPALMRAWAAPPNQG